VTLFDQLTPDQQEHVLRVAVHAEERAALAGHDFEMSLDDVAEAMDDFGGLNDPFFVLPAGLVGKW
jgi:hypothetical protein